MNEQPTQTPRGDQPYTIALSLICLVVGVPLAVAVGAILWRFGAGEPRANAGSVSVSAFGQPLALLMIGIILAVAIFWLPMRIANRSKRVLDPIIYPWLGVLTVAGLLVVGFFVAIAAGVI